MEAVPRSSPYGAPPGAMPQAAAPVVSPFRPMASQPATVADHCDTCRRHAPTKQVTFMQNIGCIVIRFPKTIRGNLCRLCISRFFWRYTLITFFFGWWGVISFFYSLVSIPTNIVGFIGARSLPVNFEPAGQKRAA